MRLLTSPLQRGMAALALTRYCNYTDFEMDALGLVDSHIHLTDFEAGTDVRALVERAAAAGVTCFVCNGTSEEDWRDVRRFAEAECRVIPCFGVHPWFVSKRSDEWVSVLESFLLSVPSGIGEIGLDRLPDSPDRVMQEEAFRAQLHLARKHKRPAMIHCVKAWGWLLDVLQSESGLPCGMLIHSYGGSADMIGPLAEMGAYFSFSGTALNAGRERARKALLAVPEDRLLIETDAPALLPPPEHRVEVILTSDGREHNSPVNLLSILNGAAALLDEPPDQLRDRLARNASKFFGPILKTRGCAD